MSPSVALKLPFETLGWDEQGLWFLDQTKLPQEQTLFRPQGLPDLIDAIQRMVVRGAPALGCAAAYGLVYACILVIDHQDMRLSLETTKELAGALRRSRPTAVNLGVGLDHVLRAAQDMSTESWQRPQSVIAALFTAAEGFHQEDRNRCQALGEQGLALLQDGQRILTHCNAGALATGGIGTALAPLHLAASRGMNLEVYADETRPLRQGARLTAWEMVQSGIPVHVLPDSAAGSLLASGQIDVVFVGSDRIAANGDVANKIGTYPLAVLAARHQVPFYVLAPTTTVDPTCAQGNLIPIEQRSATELLGADGANGALAHHPAFDVTPAELVTGIILEDAVYAPGSEAWAQKVARLGA